MNAGRWTRALRLEDGVLAAWLGVLSPALATGTDRDMPDGPLTGVAMVLAALLAVACLATRPADEPPLHLADDRTAPRWILAGPLLGGLSLVSGIGFERLGAPGGGPGNLVFVVGVAATAFHRWLPAVPPWVRRLLVLPFMLVASSLFSALTADIIGAIDPGDVLAAIGTPEWGLVAFVSIMVVGGLAAFYAMLIVAPRQLADPEDAGVRWVVRFALFLLASLTGIGWLTLIG